MTGSKIVGAGDGVWCPKCGDQPVLGEETDDGVVEHRCHNGHEWTVAADGGESEPLEFPDPPFERFEDYWMDLVTAPEFIRDDRKYWDHKYAYPGSLGRLSFDVAFVGEDGFGDIFESLAGADREVLPDEYGGIQVAQDACCDYVAVSWECLEHSPDRIRDAVAIARDPLVAAAALRMWYDRQVGQSRYMVRKGDRYRRQFEKEREQERKEDGLDIGMHIADQGRECASCGVPIGEGERVWEIAVSPGRTYEDQCKVCARSKVNNAVGDGWTINGPDPRDYTSGSSEPVTDGGVDLDGNDHYCNICDTPFDTVEDLIEHDCEDDREYHLETNFEEGDDVQ